MTGSGTDHQVGINHVCPGCGAKSGGLIPKSHYPGCRLDARSPRADQRSHPMTDHDTTPGAPKTEALAEVMSDADRGSAEYPFSDLSRAEAVLASDWLATRDAAQRAAALYEARDALYRGEGPDAFEDADIRYGEWLGNRAERGAQC